MKTKLVFFLLFGLSQMLPVQAQIQEAPQWQVTADKEAPVEGEEITLTFTAEVPNDWYMYSNDFDPDLGPMLTEAIFEENNSFELLGDFTPIGSMEKFDPIWNGDIRYFTQEAVFQQKIKVLDPEGTISGSVTYQICTDVTGQCIPYETGLKYAFSGNASEVIASSDNEIKGEQGGVPVKKLEPFGNRFAPQQAEGGWAGLVGFFLISFAGGLAALLTPCVFPMIPMTVSYFTKSEGTKREGVIKASVYGLSIIAIYTLAGTLFALIFGAEFANFLSTHWLPNMLFFAIFVLFALSFFGLFEIQMPNKLVNKMDQKAGKGGYLGIFFMAFTLVLVSFSCTGPIAGTILLEAASGQAIKPLVGMLGFSLAFAIPFTLFAIFPGWLNNLPKSGGWMNTVKVVLGFLELALALKFLSIVDQVYHWNILDRDIYLALWIVIFALLGFYLLGKIVFPHENKPRSTSVPRLMTAILVFSFVLYLIPGLFGAPLKGLAGYLPPISTQDFKLFGPGSSSDSGPQLAEGCEVPKYNDLLKLPLGLQGYFDYDQALACAKMQNKPLFIDFTGHGCVNCREMEAAVWSDPAVLRRLQKDYVVVALYVDEKTELPQKSWYISAYDNKLKKNMGSQNMDFMIQRLNANAQPYYTLVGTDGELLVPPYGYDRNVQRFVRFLDEGKEHFEQQQVVKLGTD